MLVAAFPSAPADERKTFQEHLDELCDGDRKSICAEVGILSLKAANPADYAASLDIDSRYADLDLGLADCALIVLAARHRTTRILTFDERHFRAVTPLRGKAFTLLPADA